MPTLSFKGKSFIQTHHLTVKYHALLPDTAASLTDRVSPTDNLIIQGDNLIALKALLPTYGGQVKCIYIDPPYNTGNEGWRYNDNVNSPMMQTWLKANSPVDKEDQTRHDKWLCMMMPRLYLLRDLLRDDGVIFVSIDDNEVHHLRMLMDEIFGEQNFIAQLVWEKGRKNDARLFSVGHDYILVYSRSTERLKELKTIWREEKPGAKELWEKYLLLRDHYHNDDQTIEKELREWFKNLSKTNPAKKLSRYKQVDQYGPWRDRDISWPGGNGPRYKVLHPVTHKACKVPPRGWVFSTPEVMQKQIDLGLVVFREDESQPPFRKAHLRPIPEELEDEAEIPEQENVGEDDESEEIGLQVMPSVIYKQSQVAVKYLRSLMGEIAFKNPKDHEVLMRLIRYCTSAKTNDVILDSFAGSGTTAQAVLELNKEDGGNRKFILVEMEDYADSLTAERVRRVIRGVPEARNEKLKEGLGGSFSFFRLGPPIEADGILAGTALPAYVDLARYLFYTATGEPFDPAIVNPETHFIGESSRYVAYLLYKPDKEFLMSSAAALTMEIAQSLPGREGKKRLVFAADKYLGQEHLEALNMDFVRIPHEALRYQI